MAAAEDINSILDEYVERVVPALLHQQYHLTLVKGGPDYPHLSEQSHFTHIVNGVFGLMNVLRFSAERRVSIHGLDATTVRQALVLYTTHEVHKAKDFTPLGKSEFSIPLERLREEHEQLGLDEFAQADEHLMRAINTHKRSPRQGDLLLADGDGSLLWLLARIADSIASAQDPKEAQETLTSYLRNLGPVFAAKSPPGQYALYYHQIKDVRGVLTNTIHHAVAQQLQTEYGFFPLLYFATGALYLGPATLKHIDPDVFISQVIDHTLAALVEHGIGVGAIRDGLRRQKFDFEHYVHAFADVSSLLEVVKDETQSVFGKSFDRNDYNTQDMGYTYG